MIWMIEYHVRIIETARSSDLDELVSVGRIEGQNAFQRLPRVLDIQVVAPNVTEFGDPLVVGLEKALPRVTRGWHVDKAVRIRGPEKLRDFKICAG